jgi:hypothetical protein
LGNEAQQMSFVCDFAYWNGVAMMNSVGLRQQMDEANINTSKDEEDSENTRIILQAIDEFGRGLRCPHAIAGILPRSIQAHSTLLSAAHANDPGLLESLGELFCFALLFICLLLSMLVH